MRMVRPINCLKNKSSTSIKQLVCYAEGLNKINPKLLSQNRAMLTPYVKTYFIRDNFILCVAYHFNTNLGTESLTICDIVKTLTVVLDRDITFSNHVIYRIQ